MDLNKKVLSLMNNDSPKIKYKLLNFLKKRLEKRIKKKHEDSDIYLVLNKAISEKNEELIEECFKKLRWIK